MKLEPPLPIRQALRADTIAVSDDLLLRFDLKPGDPVKLGDGMFRVLGVVAMEPIG